MMPRNTPIGTLYRRAIRRVDRRAATYRATLAEHLGFPCVQCLREDEQLLREACRLANNLAQSLPVRPARRTDR